MSPNIQTFENLWIPITINFRMFECLVTCFLRVTVSLLYRLEAVSKIHVAIYPCLIISEGRRNCSTFWSAQLGKATKPRLSGYMLPNINTFENEYWYISENLRIVALKLLELTQLTSPKISIYFNFVRRCGSVVMSIFLNEPYCTVLCWSTFCSILKIK